MSALIPGITVNEQAEQAVIGSLMRDPDGSRIIRLGITSELFTDPTRRDAFQGIAAFIADGVPLDAPTLRASISDATYMVVETCFRDTVSPANLAAHVSILKECHHARLIQDAKRRYVAAIDADAPDDEIAAIARTLSDLKAGASPGAVPGGLRFCDMSRLHTVLLSPPAFVIEPLLPRDQVTLLGGHGGGGKTLVSNILSAHIACGVDWAGLSVPRGKVLIVSFEDPEALMLWRLKKIAVAYGLDMDAIIENVRLIDATEAQPIMREVSVRGVREVQPTPDGAALAKIIGEERYDLVMIDNASDAFDGDENNRRQVRQFIRYLANAIRIHHGALLLLAHIDKAAARHGAVGNSYSGSTAWHNSVRSRLALIDGALSQEKLNVGKKLGDAIRLRFSEHGVPVLDDGVGDREAREQQDAADDAALLACFAAAQEAGDTVTTAETGQKTTWHTLSKFPECPPDLRKDKDRFKLGIARLARQKKIIRESYVNTYRHERERYVMDCVKCVKPEIDAGLTQPPQPTPHARASNAHRGVGGSTRAESTCAELTQPAPLSPLAKLILERLASQPAGVPDDELKRALANGKGTSAAMIDAELAALVKAGLVAKVNDRWVKMGAHS